MDIYTKLRVANKDSWIEQFDKTASLFIHIPKAAGTSISTALYGMDPWHYTYKDYHYLPSWYKRKLFKFSFVRNPYSRISSTYKYSFIQTKKHPSTSVSFITKYPSFEKFVVDWINSKNICNHYFFYPQRDYIEDDSGKIAIDFIGRMETIDEDFSFVKERLGLNVMLPKLNIDKTRGVIASYNSTLADIVYRAYEKDFLIFGYDKESWRHF